MNFDEISCPGGEISQTGKAVLQRYGNSGVCIKNIKKLSGYPLERGAFFTTPIWNSNQGEIEKSEYVWNKVREDEIKILDLWPKRIEFLCLVRKDFKLPIRKLGSVIVVTTQCSGFLNEHSISIEDESFIEYELSSDALKEFEKENSDLDSVLVAPGNDYSSYEVFEDNAENENNFTSFITISDSLDGVCEDVSSILTGVTMQNLSGETLEKAQQEFFEAIANDSSHISNFPSLIFVFNRANEVGLLFEDKEGFSEGDYLDAEVIDGGGIVVHEKVGALNTAYTNELKQIISEHFHSFNDKDFFQHKGDRAHLFACPALNMYTHGFDDETVKKVVVFYLNLLFDFINLNNSRCDEEHLDLFKKYKDDWSKEGQQFFERKFNENLIK